MRHRSKIALFHLIYCLHNFAVKKEKQLCKNLKKYTTIKMLFGQNNFIFGQHCVSYQKLSIQMFRQSFFENVKMYIKKRKIQFVLWRLSGLFKIFMLLTLMSTLWTYEVISEVFSPLGDFTVHKKAVLETVRIYRNRSASVIETFLMVNLFERILKSHLNVVAKSYFIQISILITPF